ncbi:hypothetical protein BDF21DRAFT_495890 [Thamnidium elegans]|uniref:Uncharacterized protein n=1 Tax=Thamnidium elegans TaxID=101142 RepID=A0A8H7SN47_9FUNG|nr:hypothetical protein INT48_000882 [Thamnidium elegans]KAI8070285.1 hypothetical protein BDF21DRAFT_495890 [Thamnidium elegans]
MCDLNWCTVCDKAIACESDSLYCSSECFSKDAGSHNNHNFQFLLAPKIHYRSFVSEKKGNKELPELSIYTTSTTSTTTSLLTQNESCCDYCHTTNKNHSFINALGPFDLPTRFSNLEYSG